MDTPERYPDIEALEAFIQSAPPGELGIVTSDIRNILTSEGHLMDSLAPAFKRYHEDQFAVVKIPQTNNTAIISKHNRLADGRYYDVNSSSSFLFDPISKSVSEVESFDLESTNSELIRSLYQPIKAFADNHHPSNAVSVFLADNDTKIAIVIVANQYNSRNFWNGRWRSCYFFDPSTGSLTGSIKIDIHYFEDGNVRFISDKPIEDPVCLSSSSTAIQIAHEILAHEEKYHESLNKTFNSMSGSPLKDLRPKLPVTKQKIDWDKIAMSKISHDLADLSFRS